MTPFWLDDDPGFVFFTGKRMGKTHLMKELQMQDLKQRVKNDFAFHAVTELDRDRMDIFRKLHLTLAETLVSSLREGRELSMALQKLEESMFWANAAIARNSSSKGF